MDIEKENKDGSVYFEICRDETGEGKKVTR
jgi:hypothetical protein